MEARAFDTCPREKTMTIAMTPDLAAKIASQKSNWSASKKRSRSHQITIYVCAYCRVQGRQLMKEGPYLVCSDKVKCLERKTQAEKKASEDASHPRIESRISEVAKKLGLK